MNKMGLQVCEAISLQTMCAKFCLNVGKLLFYRCQECLDCIQNMGLKWWKLRLQKLMFHLINNAEMGTEINVNFYCICWSYVTCTRNSFTCSKIVLTLAQNYWANYVLTVKSTKNFWLSSPTQLFILRGETGKTENTFTLSEISSNLSFLNSQ